MQLSSFIGKPVLSRAGERLGYVTALRFARGFSRIACLICADADEEELFLPASAVLSVADAVIVGRQRLNAPTGESSPVGQIAYLCTGEELGTVADIETGEAPLLIVGGSQGEQKIPVARAAIGETIIVYPSEKERRAAGAVVRKTPPRTPKNQTIPAKRTAAPQPDASAVRIDHANLLGRVVRRSVFDDRGRLIAQAGERVNAATIGRARRENRLLALTVNTLTEPVAPDANKPRLT